MGAPVRDGRERRRIIVGVDGSLTSGAALRWATEEARRWSAELVLLHVEPPSVPPWHPPAERTAEQVVDLAERIRSQGVAVTAQVATGDPAGVLLARSANADLLVMGGQGFGAHRGLLLGGVAQECARRARCPVVLVPGQ
ncbi:MAG: universal stress protein [Actinobacteria bacterium]|nr:universal stress protein [Actinomycetota bacterium]